MKHSPQIALTAARNELESARDNCPHWDYEDDCISDLECCYRVSEAKEAYRLARAKFTRIERNVAR
jgi:hypothetical protein